jgi:O-methyltransferase
VLPVTKLRDQLDRARRAFDHAKTAFRGERNPIEDDLQKEVNLQREAYLQLLMRCIIGTIYRDPPLRDDKGRGYDPEVREYGWDWPSSAHSMIGRKRMENVRNLVESVLGEHVPGDLIETGVWRGGACIFMRGILKTYGVRDRIVWVADSFEGLPKPDENRYPADRGDAFHTFKELAITLEEVQDNFARYDLLDDRVRFLKGWFKDTLATAPIDRLALLRLDGDMYESTMDALTPLYPKLSRGGYVIVDDYHVVAGCKQAVEDYRAAHAITDPLREIDGVGVYWQRST